MDMVGDGMFNEWICVGCDLDKRCVESHSTMKYNTSVFSPGNNAHQKKKSLGANSISFFNSFFLSFANLSLHLQLPIYGRWWVRSSARLTFNMY